MRKKMAAAVLMAAMTASLLAGCGDSKSSDSTKADSAQTTASNQSEAGDSTSDLKDGKTEELLMVWPGSNASPADMQAVEDAMNEIIGEKVDAKVKLQIIEWGAYNDQTNLMLSSGEKLDMVFLMSNIREDGQRGQLYPINDLVETNVILKHAISTVICMDCRRIVTLHPRQDLCAGQTFWKSLDIKRKISKTLMISRKY